MHYTNLIKILIALCASCCPVFLCAQESHVTNFTVKEGLPSNHVYRCVEDDHGFLWVATDAGIARFDGKYFQVFTTEHGLPDNEVLSVVKEKNGRIWVNCFRQSPAYFDERKNRFINASQDSNLAKVSGTTGMHLFALPDGGVMYHTEGGSYIFRDNNVKVYESRKQNNLPVTFNSDGSFVRWGTTYRTDHNLLLVGLFHKRSGHVVDSAVMFLNRGDLPTPFINDNRLYIFTGRKKKFYVYSDIVCDPVRFRLDSIDVPENFSHSDFTQNSLYLLGFSGKLYIYEKQTLVLKKVIEGEFLANSYYSDKLGNEWISTVDQGLIAYRKHQLPRVEIPRNFSRTNFLSVARTRNGSVLAGNYYGEIIEARGADFITHKIIPGYARQRDILVIGKDIFSFSELGTFRNFSEPVLNPITKVPHPAKMATKLTDSLIVVGYTSGMLLVNSRTLQLKRLSVNNKRITALVKVSDSIIYFGSTDGLYKYNLVKDTTLFLSKKNNVPDHRVTALGYTKDGLLWMATAGQGIFVLKNDQLVRTISTADGILANSIRCLTEGKKGDLWLGTASGLSVLSYSLTDQQMSVNVQNLTVNDGLTSNEINDIWIGYDSSYLATSDGVSIVPQNFSTAPIKIPLRVVDVMINDNHVPIMAEYSLSSREQNIRIQVAGIDLGGHFSHIQYLLDQHGDWINSYQNILNFQLPPGTHLLQVRAVDVNGRISKEVLSVSFDIKTPFWRTLWFMAAVLLLLQVLIAYIIWTRRRKLSRLRVARQIAGVQNAALEQQAFTSLMNPHFIFNALNSVQHYINLQDRQNANRYLSDFASLIRKNFEAAQKSFIPLEEELESIRIYLRLEQMRFKDKFSYAIDVAEEIDAEEWMIPTMIIQPLMENAILHGIMPSVIPGKLTLSIAEDDGNLRLSITDNGIGLKNSAGKKSNSLHKSRSVELIRKRLSALNHFTKTEVDIQITNGFDSTENPGTKTTILIPRELYPTWKLARKEEKISHS